MEDEMIKYQYGLTSVLPFIKIETEKRPINIKIKDIKEKMGPEFEKKTDIQLFWGLKYSLWKHGIVVEGGLTRTGENLLMLRKATPQDIPIIPEDLIEMEKITDGEGIFYTRKVIVEVVTDDIFGLTYKDIEDIIDSIETTTFNISAVEIGDWKMVKER